MKTVLVDVKLVSEYISMLRPIHNIPKTNETTPIKYKKIFIKNK